MSEYSDTWDLLNQPLARAADLSPKGQDFALIQANTGSARLTPDESYKMAWGQDATTEDWVRQKAEAIRKEIDGSSSIAVLRHGTLAKARAAAGDPSAAAAEAGAVANGSAAGGSAVSGESRGDGSIGNDGSPGGATTNAGMSMGLNGLGIDVGLSGLGAARGAASGFASAGPLGAVMGGLAGGLSISRDPLGAFAKAALDQQVERDAETLGSEPNNGLNGGLGTPGAPDTGPGTIGSRDTHGSNESGGNSDGGVGGSQGHGGSSDGGSGGDSGEGGRGGVATGGLITANMLSGPNPKGPDDGYTALDVGEYVIRASQVKRYGADVMAALNAGRIPLAAVRNLLNFQD